jgi:hypothetical protein
VGEPYRTFSYFRGAIPSSAAQVVVDGRVFWTLMTERLCGCILWEGSGGG